MAIGIHELPKRPSREYRVLRTELAIEDSIAQVREHFHGFPEEPIVVFDSEIFGLGEPISDGRNVAKREIVEKASKKDILLRQAEQIDRLKRMLEVGTKITPQWRRYALNNAPNLLFDAYALQNSS
jgi:hypothetical protein